MADDNEEPEPEFCDLEWPHDRKQSLCRLHRCQLPLGHKGPHVCDSCGWERRNMKRDSPEPE